jgi:hypothetical protein
MLVAQNKANVEDIFKMQLFLEKVMIISKEWKEIKDNSLYLSFCNGISLRFDTLKSINIDERFEFYSLKKIDYKKKESFEVPFYYAYDEWINYVLCINVISGKSYRLVGFDGNDFLDFLRDYKEMLLITYNYVITYQEAKSDKYFLKNCFVDGIDFKCLYNGLYSRNKEYYELIKKYPCLKKSSDPMIDN